MAAAVGYSHGRCSQARRAHDGAPLRPQCSVRYVHAGICLCGRAGRRCSAGEARQAYIPKHAGGAGGRGVQAQPTVWCCSCSLHGGKAEQEPPRCVSSVSGSLGPRQPPFARARHSQGTCSPAREVSGGGPGPPNGIAQHVREVSYRTQRAARNCSVRVARRLLN